MKPNPSRVFRALCVASALLAASLVAQTAPPTLQERLGYPATARLLILHADDLGMAHSVNSATLEALEKGWITSASILVPCPWLPEAARWAAAHPDADLGIHLALNSEWTTLRWGPVIGRDRVPSLLDAQGFLPLESDEVVHKAKPSEVETELRAQIELARAQGIHITHLDAHMGTLMQSPAFFEIYLRVGREYGLPVLHRPSAMPGGDPSTYPQPADEFLDADVVSMSPGVSAKDWLDAYRKMLAPLKPGVYQLIIHLAHDDEEMRGATADHPDWGAAWRQQDFDLVRSTEFQQFLREQGFILVNWKTLARALPATYIQHQR
jgi:chitin disaccharide deacetylase